MHERFGAYGLGEYTPKGGSAQATTHPTLTSNVKFMNFYPFNDNETISSRPMLFISGDQAIPRSSAKMRTTSTSPPKRVEMFHLAMIAFRRAQRLGSPSGDGGCTMAVAETPHRTATGRDGNLHRWRL